MASSTMYSQGLFWIVLVSLVLGYTLAGIPGLLGAIVVFIIALT